MNNLLQVTHAVSDYCWDFHLSLSQPGIVDRKAQEEWVTWPRPQNYLMILLGFEPRSCLSFCNTYFGEQSFTLLNMMFFLSPHLDPLEAWSIHQKKLFLNFLSFSGASLFWDTRIWKKYFSQAGAQVSKKPFYLPRAFSTTWTYVAKNAQFLRPVLLPSWDDCTSLFCTLSLIRSLFLHFSEISNDSERWIWIGF